MQTLHLRFRALRAILLGLRPSRWPTPSMRNASTWETASPLPVPLGPTSAVGAHPQTSHQRFDRCPTLGAGLTMAALLWEARVVGPGGAHTSQVCPWQTAHDLASPPQPHGGGEGRPDHGQARASEPLWAPSYGLSFPRRPARCQRAPRPGAWAFQEKTADPAPNVGALDGVSSGALGRCERARRLCSSSRRGEGAWPATTSL